MQLGFWLHVFVHLNELNWKIRGKNENILSSVDKLEGFWGKLKLWPELTASGSSEMFPIVCSFGEDKALLSVIEEHLNPVQKKFKNTLPVVPKIWTGFVIRLVLSEHHFLWKPKKN
jgi:hypothetical protein